MDSSEIGYRFHPTDEELVNHYLRLKILGNDHQVSEIPEVNILNYEPWDLPQDSVRKMLNKSNIEEGCYFFCPRIYQHSNSQRMSRTTNTGFWKVTGKHRKIKDIGIKKTLVFYQGRASRPTRTNWVMHEYIPTFNFQTQRDFVLCKLKKKADADGVISQKEVDADAETPNISA